MTGRRGPGRPEIGGIVSVALGVELLAQVDEYARAEGVPRAVAIRELLARGLAGNQSAHRRTDS